MRAYELGIRNFRSIESADIPLGNVTRIIGANGAGKSTILKALELFYAPGTPSLSADDHFGRDYEKEIEIIVKYNGLSDTEKDRFKAQLKPDNSISVSRVFTSNPKTSGKYYGRALRMTEFAGIRAVDKAVEKRTQYDLIRSAKPEYGLERVARAEDIEPNLQACEARNKDICVETRDDGQFFGFQNVAAGKLSDSTMFVYIPAVRDASLDAIEGKNSAVTRLLDLVVKSEIDRRPDFKKFKEDTNRQFSELMKPENLSELPKLATILSETLSSFYSDASVLLNWRDSQPISIPFPLADMMLDDEGFVSPVDKTGHGLQRALIITLLQHLAIASTNSAGIAPSIENPPELDEGESENKAPPDDPGLILAIEEPELYQHPTKQRHFCSVLEKIADGALPGTASNTQIIFTTHSPSFVSMEHFDEVRLVRRSRNASHGQRCCVISTADLGDIARELATAWGRDASAFSAESLKPHLHIFDGVVAEGFFAAVSVLVEGISDKAALIAAAKRQGIDFSENEIAIIPCGGKSTLDKPYLVFKHLGIPVFMLWDCDKGKRDPQPHINMALQKLLGVPESECADFRRSIDKTYACFEIDLESEIISEIGKDIFNSSITEISATYGITGRSDAQKIPKIMQDLFIKLESEGKTSPSLDAIVDAIVSMKPSPLRRA